MKAAVTVALWDESRVVRLAGSKVTPWVVTMDYSSAVPSGCSKAESWVEATAKMWADYWDASMADVTVC